MAKMIASQPSSEFATSPQTVGHKQAVVVIHGIGNQSPMATLRGFVESVWTQCGSMVLRPPARTWTKRDLKSNNYELRRITTNEDIRNRRTDFFEFYWADQMEDTQLADVVWWLKRLFLRPLNRVPPAVRGAWTVGLIVLGLIGAALGLCAWLILDMVRAIPNSIFTASTLLAIVTWLVLLFWLFRHLILVKVVGDAARYLTASPPNIAARSRIRKLGLQLLAALHQNDEYDRIIFACHSLGTVIGYDILSFYWSSINEDVHHAASDPSLAHIEQAIVELRQRPKDPDCLTRFRQAQREYAAAVSHLSGGRWKVTDFITLGAPLTYAHLLMVDDREPLLESDEASIQLGWLADWRNQLDVTTGRVAALFFARAAQREFPLCPPLSETGTAFTYVTKSSPGAIPHHAAVFAPVRWTNIFAPARNVFRGDIIGGPVAPLFGPGIKDIPLTGEVGRMMLAHTHYWDQGRRDEKHLEVLRSALNLLDR
jgi:hypothetical protein